MGCAAPLPGGYQLQIVTLLSGHLARNARTPEAARDHVQRAINALVGPDGDGWATSAGVGNPCGGFRGAIPELAAMMGQERIKGAAEAHEIARLALRFFRECLAPGRSPDDITRLCRAGCSLVQAALDCLEFP